MKSVLFLVILYSFGCFGQVKDTTWNQRSWLVAGSNTFIGGGSVALLGSVWYADYPKSDFHFFNDSKNWLYMDKLGHSYAAYQLSSAEFSAWRWSGMPSYKAALLSSGISWTYLLTVEVFDGFSAEWGFSTADLVANTVGSGLFLAQELAWKEQRLQLKFSYKASPYAAIRPNTLGSNFPERILKDYNAQSYWLSFSPRLGVNNQLWPEWLQLSVGYSADQKLNGASDTYIFEGFEYRARPEYAVSFDVDWGKLPIRKPWLKKLVKPLNALKFPFPAVYWRNGICYVGMF